MNADIKELAEHIEEYKNNLLESDLDLDDMIVILFETSPNFV